jgi:hypothetical protein
MRVNKKYALISVAIVVVVVAIVLGVTLSKKHKKPGK